jgi:PAS domain S-box-containing protein
MTQPEPDLASSPASDREKATEELSRSEERFQTDFAGAPLGLAIITLDGRFLQANQALCRLLGYPQELLRTKTLAEITYPPDRAPGAMDQRGLPEVASGLCLKEQRFLHGEGHPLRGELTLLLMRDSLGLPLYYLGQLREIPAGQESEQALRQALEKAEQERVRADAILAAIGDPLSIQDREFRVIYQNEANQRILGSHLGEHCYEAYEQNTAVCEGCAMAQAFADGTVHKAERSVTVDNETVHYDVTASPLLDKSGCPVAGIEIARNITARKKNTGLLAEQVRLLSLSSDIGAVLTKSRALGEMLSGCCELLVHHLGAAFARVWTVHGDLLSLQASAGLYTHLDGPHGQIPINQQTKIGTIASTKMPHISNEVIGDPKVSDQEWAKREGMVAFAGHPLLIEEKLIGVIGMFFRHPLSASTSRAIAAIADTVALGVERVQTEKRLRHSNRALRILGRGNEALVQTREEQELLHKICEIIVEPQGYMMAWVGYAQTDAAKSVLPMAHAGVDDGYLDAIAVSCDDAATGQGPSGAAIRSGQFSVMKTIHTDPAYHPWRAEAMKRGFASSIALPLKDLTATPFGMLGIYASEPDAFDAEEIKLLSDLADDLAYGINAIRQREERAREQQEREQLQERLRQAQKMEAIGTLAGGIAHDFNNILSAILGYSELLKDTIGDEGTAGQDLRQVITAGRRAAELVRQILAISRQSKQERQPIRIHYIIKEALKLLRPSLSTLIEIKSTIDPLCPEVFADPTEIHQLIMNLCTNAGHALLDKEGGEHLLGISLVPVELDGAARRRLALPGPATRFVELTVADSGCGMDAQTMARIFEPYFTTKEKGKGTGLGLALVHGIVKDLGGAITVESTLEQGTTFTLFLPAYEHPAAADGHGPDTAVTVGGNERLLVVDDEKAITHLLERSLSKLGYRVTAVSDGEEALRLFMEKPQAFDLIITDLNMPKVMGSDLARAVLQARPEIPIILCTGFSEKIHLEQAKAIGFREVLLKPVARDLLCRLVRKHLDAKGEARGR